MVVNATFKNIFQLYRGGQLYWWGKYEYQEKTTDLSQSLALLKNTRIFTRIVLFSSLVQKLLEKIKNKKKQKRNKTTQLRSDSAIKLEINIVPYVSTSGHWHYLESLMYIPMAMQSQCSWFKKAQ